MIAAAGECRGRSSSASWQVAIRLPPLFSDGRGKWEGEWAQTKKKKKKMTQLGVIAGGGETATILEQAREQETRQTRCFSCQLNHGP